MQQAWRITGWAGIGLLAGAAAVAAPVSGSSPPAHLGAGKARPLATAPDTADFCSALHLKTGWLIGFNLTTLGRYEQSVSPGSSAAGAPSYADIVSYLTYDDVLESATSHTGSLRWSLWAVPRNHVAGWPAMNGHRMGGFTPQFTDSTGVSRNYLYNLTEVTLRQRITTVNPPAGRYCLAVVVDMYSGNNECRSADGYCPELIYTLAPAYTFR